MADVLDQSYTNKDNSWALRYGATTNVRLGVEFVPTITAKRSKVIFWLGKEGSPSNDVWAEIYADSGSLPTGSALATSDTVACSSVSNGTGAEITFTFSGANKIQLNSGITYHLVITGDYAASETVYITFYNDVSGSYTPSGTEDWDGTDWGDAEPTTDPYFKEYYDNTTIIAGGFLFNMI